MLHDFFATCDSLFVVQLVAVVQEEKARRLFRPVRGVDLKIAWQIHARELRRSVNLFTMENGKVQGRPGWLVGSRPSVKTNDH